jgi:hypothetical protein
MKYLARTGDFIQINISEWVYINMNNPENYKIYYNDTVYADGSSLTHYYIKLSDIACIYKTGPPHGYKVYIETTYGLTHEFSGSITTTSLLHLELNAALV